MASTTKVKDSSSLAKQLESIQLSSPELKIIDSICGASFTAFIFNSYMPSTVFSPSDTL